MDAAPSPKPPPAQPIDLPAVWPRSAQLTVAFLLGLVTALVGYYTFSSSRWASRPLDRAAVRYQIDLNRAARAELLQLPGVGENLAARIEAYRDEHGPFRSIDDLVHVHGIGPAKLDRLRGWVCVHVEDEYEGDVPVRVVQLSPAMNRKPVEPVKDPGGMKKAGKKDAALAGLIDVNRASADELQRLPGIGPKMSQRIVDERRKGLFKAVEDLRRVPGIGPKTLERLRPHVTVGGGANQVATAD